MKILGGCPEEVVTTSEACGRRGRGSVSEGGSLRWSPQGHLELASHRKAEGIAGRGPNMGKVRMGERGNRSDSTGE